MRFKFLQATQVDHSRLRCSGRALPPPRPPSPMVDLWQVYPLCCIIHTPCIVLNSNATFAFPTPISPNCYLPKSGRRVTSLDQGLSSSEARSEKSLDTRLRGGVRRCVPPLRIFAPPLKCHEPPIRKVSMIDQSENLTFFGCLWSTLCLCKIETLIAIHLWVKYPFNAMFCKKLCSKLE